MEERHIQHVLSRVTGVIFVIPFVLFREILNALLQRPYHVAVGEIGFHMRQDKLELLCRSYRIVHEGEAYALPRTQTIGLSFSLVLSSLTIGRPQIWRLLTLAAWHDPPNLPALRILLGSEQETGFVTGMMKIDAQTTPLEAIHIVGPGFTRIGAVDFPRGSPGRLSSEEHERWSRLIGALGEQTWRTLTSLRYCLIGVGRLGSLLAMSLVKAGARWLTLIDPDRLELHNLDAMDGVSKRDLGRWKVDALRECLTHEFTQSSVLALPHSFMSQAGLTAAKEADVIITCTDSDAPRLLAGALACAHLKVLLDIGTGVFRSATGALDIGADIRLLLPGETCILCAGGLVDPARALSQLHGEKQPQRAWHEERAGSLRSINQVAAHLGITLLENLVASRLLHSTWLRVQIDAHGVPSLRTLPLSNRHIQCQLCMMTGCGDWLGKTNAIGV